MYAIDNSSACGVHFLCQIMNYALKNKRYIERDNIHRKKTKVGNGRRKNYETPIRHRDNLYEGYRNQLLSLCIAILMQI